jgi:hypothetical protein
MRMQPCQEMNTQTPQNPQISALSLSLSFSLSLFRSFVRLRARALLCPLAHAFSYLSAPVKETLSRARLIGGSDARMKCRVRQLQCHLLLHQVN